MEIKFNGVVADSSKIKYAVKMNNNANVIVFKVKKTQESITLDPSKKFYVKISSCMAKEFFDKDPRAVVSQDADNIYVAWTMLRKHTQFKNINIQLQYEDTSNEIVWQTEIINVDLFGYIPADEEIENLYPSILTLMQEELDDHEARITELEESGGGGGKWGSIVGDINDQTDLVNFVEGKVGEEETARVNAFNELSGDIDAEATARENADADLQQQIDNIQPVWGNITGDISDQTDLADELDTIRAIAEGSTKSYSVDTDVEGNEVFKSDAVDIVVEEFTDINGNIIHTSDLKNGDIIFTKNTATQVYRDRWLLDKETSTWSILSADDPRLENYYTKNEADALLALKADDNAVVHLTGDETIGGSKTFTSVVNFNASLNTNDRYRFNINGTNYYELGSVSFTPVLTNQGLGSTTKHWASAYINSLYGSSNVAKAVDDLALKSDIGFEAIYPTSRTLTADEVLSVIRGCVVKTTLMEYKDIIIYPASNYANIKRGICVFRGETDDRRRTYVSGYQIDASGNFSRSSGYPDFPLLFEQKNSFVPNLLITHLTSLNSRAFPAYPTSPTSLKALCAMPDNTLSWEEIAGGFQVDPTKYIIKQGTNFVQVDSIPTSYTGIAYQFGETGLQVLQFVNGEETGTTASIEDDTIALTNSGGHSISMNSNTGKILVDGEEEVFDVEYVDGTTETIKLVKNY